MNLFDAVPTVVQQNFEGYSYDEIDSYQIATAVKEVVDVCDNFTYETLTTQNRILIKRMVRNAIDLMTSDNSEDRDIFYQMIKDIEQEKVTV